jgi:hypothetical protein
MLKTKKELVKITNRGRVVMLLNAPIKYQFKCLLELFMNDNPSQPLNAVSCERLTYVALADELYRKYHTALCLLQGDCKITLTLPQAYAFWCLCQTYDKYAYADAGLGGILMQLHQRLS